MVILQAMEKQYEESIPLTDGFKELEQCSVNKTPS
jgi:hypothetical protein